MKRILSVVVAFLIIFTSFTSDVSKSFATNKEPQLTAQYAVLMDYETGKILYDKNGDKKLHPASTTKIWTAYVAIKHIPDLNQVIQVKDLPLIEGSSMYLKNGESFTVKQLLDALLVHSSNDASHVLAEYVSGSIKNFATLMNKEAKAIGTKNTNFTNPHGLPDDAHLTTAYDMALMAKEAMGNDIFKEIVKTKSIRFEPNEVYPYERYFVNTNKFLTSTDKINYKGKEIDIKYDIVDGIKTGTTDAAGRCLVTSAVKNDMRLIASVFKSVGNELYLDSRSLLDYGFDNYEINTIINKFDYVESKNVLFTKQGKLNFEPESSYKLVLPNNSSTDNYTTKVKLDKIDLPIHKGDKVGTLDIYKEDKLENTINLISKNDVNSILSFITENKTIMSIIKIILVILISFIVFILFKNKNNKKRNIINSKKRRK